MIRLFEGIECEGRFRGVHTLFVSGNVPLDAIKLYYAADNFGQIYFGSDGLSEINWNIVDICLSHEGMPNIITAEFGSLLPPRYIMQNPHFHSVINIKGVPPNKLREFFENLSAYEIDQTQVKFDSTSKSYLAPASAFISNWKSAIKDDVELWRQE